MEVTRHNFQQALPEIEAAIKDADFLAVDGEFTGLFSGSDVNSFDTPKECYQFYRRGSKQFLLIQFGLSAFRFDADAGRFSRSTFTFYLFPRPEIKGASDKVFSCQSSSVHFLSKHKFDFNKVFHDGISYIDTAEEVKLREFIEEKQTAEKAAKKPSRESIGNVIAVPPNFQSQIDQMCSKVEEFLKDSKKKCVEFENLNAFQRKLTYQELETKFKNEIFMETRNVDDKRILVVSRGINEQERLARMEEAHEKDWAEVDAAVGFSTVARLISDSRKLIVGHNMVLDLMHVMDSFFYPLPDDYDTFKALIPHIFPNLIDTMYLLKMTPLKDLLSSVDLKSLFTSLQTEPFVMPKIENSSNSKDSISEEFHDAGYDSYVTGACLISMFEYLKKTEALGNDDSLNAESMILKTYLNKLFLYKTHFQGSPCINLAGKDPNPSRGHVFHLTFPKSWKRNEISDLFDRYGGLSTIAFIDDTSAYVSLRQHGKAEAVRRELFTNNENFKLTSYWDYKKSTSPKSKTDICAMDQSPNTPTKTVDIFEESSLNKSNENLLKRKTSELERSEPVSSLPPAPKPPKYGKKRKHSHTSSGDFLISGNVNKEDEDKLSDVSKVFEENNVWD